MLINKIKEKEIFIAVIILIIWLIALWLRTGKIPAPIGDVVYYSEGAYWLLERGQLTRFMYPDVLGSNIRQFLPPVVSFFQFISFYLFGLNQFSMNFFASFFVTLLTLVIFLIAIKKKWPISVAIYSAIAFGCIPTILQYGLRVRNEIYYTFLLLLTIYILLYTYRNKYSLLISSFFAGLLIGLSILAYYPMVTALALSGILLIYFSYSKEHVYRVFLGFILGVAVVGFLSILWIFPDFDLFIKQNTSMGAAKYSDRQFLDYITSYGAWRNIIIGFVAFLFLKFYALKYKLDQAKACLIIVIIISLHYIISPFVEFTSFVLLIVGILLLGNQVFSSNFQKIILNIFRLMAICSLSLMILLVFKSFSPERNYKIFSKEILNNTNLNKIVLSDHAGWLALRPVLNKDQLIGLRNGVGVAQSIVIDFLLDTNNASKVSAVVFIKENEARYSEIYPLFNELINNANCNKKKIGLGSPLQVMVLNCIN
jgi:hypothetical protein